MHVDMWTASYTSASYSLMMDTASHKMTHMPCMHCHSHSCLFFDVFGVTQPCRYQQDSTYIRHRFCMFCYVHQSHGPYLSQTLKDWKPFSWTVSDISLRSDGLISSVTSKSHDLLHAFILWLLNITMLCLAHTWKLPVLLDTTQKQILILPSNRLQKVELVWITWALSCNRCLFLFLFRFILAAVAIHFLSVQCVSIAFPKQQGSASKAKKDEE